MQRLSKQEINTLAASFYPAIRAYFESEQSRAEYQKYLEEKADNAKSAENGDTNNNDNNAA